jgi:hypothetical protein
MNVDDALQHCLEELDAGRLTIAECAALYPHLEDLPAQLAAAQALRAEPAPEFSSAASAALKAQLLAHWRARANGRAVEPAVPSAVAPPRPERMAPVRQPRWRWPRLLTPRLALALAGIVVLLAASAGTLSAAGSSLPGQWLYPIKRSVETWQIAWTPAADQAKAHLELIDERAQELQALANRSALDLALLTAAANAFAEQCAAALGSVAAAPAGEREALLEAIIAAIADEEAALSSVITQAPAPAVPALTEALARTQAQYDRAVLALEAARAGTETPPGQTQVPPGQTQVPPGQTRRPNQTNPPPGQTKVPPGQTKVPPGQQTDTPDTQTTPPASATLVPGQANKTATRTPHPTHTPRPTNPNQGGGAGGPICNASNSNSPNYCTPTPAGNVDSNLPPPTACPTNPGGQPKCN